MILFEIGSRHGTMAKFSPEPSTVDIQLDWLEELAPPHHPYSSFRMRKVCPFVKTVRILGLLRIDEHKGGARICEKGT